MVQKVRRFDDFYKAWDMSERYKTQYIVFLRIKTQHVDKSFFVVYYQSQTEDEKYSKW